MVSFLHYESGEKLKNKYHSNLPSHEPRLCSVQKGTTHELIELIHH